MSVELDDTDVESDDPPQSVYTQEDLDHIRAMWQGEDDDPVHYCPRCHSPVVLGARYCENCGATQFEENTEPQLM